MTPTDLDISQRNLLGRVETMVSVSTHESSSNEAQMSTPGCSDSELRDCSAILDCERDILSPPLSSPPDEGHLHRAGLLQPRGYVSSRIHTQPRLSGEIRDSTVQLSKMHFPSLGQSFDFSLLQELPLASARNPSRDSFISPPALDHNTNPDPDGTHFSATTDFSPFTSMSTPTSDSQTTNASQLALPNSGSMSDRDYTEPALSGLSLLLARKRSPSKDTDSSGFRTTPPFSPNLTSIEERLQSTSDSTLQTHLASFTNRLSDTGYDDHRRSNACEDTGGDVPGVANERTPLIYPCSPPHDTAVTRSPSGPVPNKKSTIHGFPRRFHRQWTTLEPMGLDVLARTAILAIPAVILGALLNALDGLSYGMIIFPASGVFARLGGMGVSIFFVSTVVAQLVFTLGGSNFAGANGSMMIEVVPFFHILATTIAREVGEENVREVIATTLVSFALSSFLTGLTFFLLGYFRLGVLIGFFPRHILVGCIGGVGVFLVLTGLTVSARLPSDALDPPTLETLRYFVSNSHALAQWVPPVVLAVLLRIMTARWKHQLIFPVYFLIIPIAFYVIVIAASLDLDKLRKDGWLFELAPGTGDKWYEFYSYYDLNLIRWTPLWSTLSTQFALLIFNVLHPPFNVPALSVSLDQDIDTNQELVGHGFSNLLSGLLGSVPNYLVYVNTLLFYRVGGGNRVAGFMLAITSFLLLIMGSAPIAYIPVVVVSTLIVVLGIDLVKEALWDTRHRVSRMEYITIISIMVTMTVWDFVIGVLFGIIVSCFFFVIQNSQRRSIRVFYSGDAAMSTVRRPAAHRAYIREVSKQTRILQLQGFLFFGTIAHVEDKLRGIVNNPNWRRDPVRFVIVDLALVAGVDMSSAEAFVRVQRLLAAKGVVLVFCGASTTSLVGKALASSGILEEPQVELCETLNDAMEWTENAYLRAWFRVQKTKSTPIGRQALNINFHDTLSGSPRGVQLRDAGERTIAGEILSEDVALEPFNTFLKTFQSYDEVDHDVLTKLVPYFERVSLPAGHVLWEIGDAPDGLYIIQSGILRASYKFAEHTPVIEESMLSGTLAGEMSALSGLPRNATVMVEHSAVVWKLSTTSMRQLEQDHPHVAQAFLRLVLKAAKVDTDVLLAALAAR